MPIDSRIRGHLPGPGPYVAKITNVFDPTYMGSLEVILEKGYISDENLQSQTYIVKYLSPFYGVTNVKFEGTDQRDFNSVQKSYGMWFVPPDVGTSVLVIFVGGDPNLGYWIGCIPDQFQNHMIPGIAATQNVHMTPEQELRYGTKNLPTAEFHKRSAKANISPSSQLKPIHPFADRLLAQGLLIDNVRGITTSSPRREMPSAVFGISTPGPVDRSPNSQQGIIGYQSKRSVNVSRLGGTQFVMDDGDENGQNELVRIRTRTGHQILLHNSADLVYIANSKGTAWIEMTSNGKIDIYAADSISMHTEGDFNFRADRDINLEAGRDFNVATINGEMNVNIKTDINTICDTMKTLVVNDHEMTVNGNFRITVDKNMHIKVDQSMFTSVTENIHVSSSEYHESTVFKNMDADTYRETVGTSHYRWQGDKYMFTGANTYNVAASGYTDFGCPTSRSGAVACPTVDPAIAAIQATLAEQPIPLNLYLIPRRDPSQGWSNGNFYKASDVLSIMQRVPMHEPWDQHENTNPAQFTLDKTSSKIQATTKAQTGVVVPADNSANVPYPAKNGPANDRGTVQSKPFPWTTDQPFLDKVKQVAAAVGFPVIDLLACMNLESNRTFDPAITNNLGFTGLIQFGVPAASQLGTTTAELRQMSRVRQMDYVQAYFTKLWGWPNAKCPNPTLVNIYLTILLPAFRFAAPDQQIAIAGDPKSGKWYSANKGFDPQRLGYFTPAMIEATVSQHKREVERCLAKAGVVL